MEESGARRHQNFNIDQQNICWLYSACLPVCLREGAVRSPEQAVEDEDDDEGYKRTQSDSLSLLLLLLEPCCPAT